MGYPACCSAIRGAGGPAGPPAFFFSEATRSAHRRASQLAMPEELLPCSSVLPYFDSHSQQALEHPFEAISMTTIPSPAVLGERLDAHTGLR